MPESLEGEVQSLDDLEIWVPTYEEWVPDYDEAEQWIDFGTAEGFEEVSISRAGAGPELLALGWSPPFMLHRVRCKPGSRPTARAQDYLALATSADVSTSLPHMQKPTAVTVGAKTIYVDRHTHFSFAFSVPDEFGEPAILTLDLSCAHYSAHEAERLIATVLTSAVGPDDEPLFDSQEAAAIVGSLVSSGRLHTAFSGSWLQSTQEAVDIPASETSDRNQQRLDEIAARAATIQIEVPIEEEDYYDSPALQKLPLIDRTDADEHRWIAFVNLSDGQIHDWQQGVEFALWLKVTDRGRYALLDSDGSVVARVEGGYVPHGVVPGSSGDYISLKIGADGRITNWPAALSFDEFAAAD